MSLPISSPRLLRVLDRSTFSIYQAGGIYNELAGCRVALSVDMRTGGRTSGRLGIHAGKTARSRHDGCTSRVSQLAGWPTRYRNSNYTYELVVWQVRVQTRTQVRLTYGRGVGAKKQAYRRNGSEKSVGLCSKRRARWQRCSGLQPGCCCRFWSTLSWTVEVGSGDGLVGIGEVPSKGIVNIFSFNRLKSPMTKIHMRKSFSSWQLYDFRLLINQLFDWLDVAL